MESKAIDGLKQDYSHAQKQIQESFSAAKAKLSDFEKNTEEYITENPKKAIAIAAGVGAIIAAATTAL